MKKYLICQKSRKAIEKYSRIMTDATVATINLGPLSLPLVSKSFRSLFPHCEYEKHISEAYSPPGFFIICGSRASKGVLKLAFLTHLNDGVKVVTIERSRILDNVQKFRQEISLALQIDDDSLRDKTKLQKPVPLGIHHAGKYTPQMVVVDTTI